MPGLYNDIIELDGGQGFKHEVKLVGTTLTAKAQLGDVNHMSKGEQYQGNLQRIFERSVSQTGRTFINSFVLLSPREENPKIFR